MLLGALALAISAGLGTPTPVPADPPRSLLPATQPGRSAAEGVFLITATDDGSQVVYFIAQNTRHSTLPDDLQREQQINPLWPVRVVDRDVVLAFSEAAAVGRASVGLLSSPVAELDDAEDDIPLSEDETPLAADEPPALEPPLDVEAAKPAAEAPARASPRPQRPVAVDPPVPLAAWAAHTVRAGDTLYKLSVSNGTTVQAIASANGLRNPDLILVGQTITIPVARAAPEPKPQPATDRVVTPRAPFVADTQPLATYTVRAGDTLNKVSAQNGTTVRAIVDANRIRNPDLIFVGQSVRIPGLVAASEHVGQSGGAEQPAPAADEAPSIEQPAPAPAALAPAVASAAPAPRAAGASGHAAP